MQRWHLTFGLATLALVAATIAPRLMKAGTAEAAADAPPEVPALQEQPAITPIAEVAPDRAGHLVVSAGLDRTAVAAGTTSERYLVVTVAAPADATARRPVDLTVVVDTSGSMKRQGKMEMAKVAAERLYAGLNADDEFALVGFADYGYHVSRPAPGGATYDVGAAIRGMRPTGETNLADGLTLGGKALFAGASTAEKRVVIVSDGYPTVGDKSSAGLSRLAEDLRSRGVAVSTIGLGIDFDEDLLAGMSAAGGGRYAFVDSAADLDTAFDRELSRTATLVARDTKVRITVPQGVELVDFVGRTAARDGDGWLVDVGSISAGELRKVVARVRVSAGAPGAAPIASVAATWDDRVDQAPGFATVGVSAAVTDAVAEAEVSYDRLNNVAANEARGGWFMDQAARAFARGDAEEAQAITERARDELAAPMAATPSVSLSSLDADLAVQADVYDAPTEPVASAPKARRAVLDAKATALEYSQ